MLSGKYGHAHDRGLGLGRYAACDQLGRCASQQHRESRQGQIPNQLAGSLYLWKRVNLVCIESGILDHHQFFDAV